MSIVARPSGVDNVDVIECRHIRGVGINPGISNSSESDREDDGKSPNHALARHGDGSWGLGL